MGWTFYNASGEALTSFGPVALTDLDIDGGTDIGEAIVDADLFIVDNGAGGTNVKTAASRIVTYVAANAQAVQSDIEAETNQDTYVPPDLLRKHPGMAKVWAKSNAAGTLAQSHNVSSLTKGGAGIYTINFTVAQSGDNTYAVGVFPSVSSNVGGYHLASAGTGAFGAYHIVTDDSNTHTNTIHSMFILGDES